MDSELFVWDCTDMNGLLMSDAVWLCLCSKQDIESNLCHHDRSDRLTFTTGVHVFHRQQLRLDSNSLQALMLQLIRNVLGSVCHILSILI